MADYFDDDLEPSYVDENDDDDDFAPAVKKAAAPKAKKVRERGRGRRGKMEGPEVKRESDEVKRVGWAAP